MELISVLKYEGSNEVFVHKHPKEDFNFGTQLIVHESQEALFFKDGRALDLFTAGRHTLQTYNLPLVKDLIAKGTGGENIFHAEVFMGVAVDFMFAASTVPRNAPIRSARTAVP